MSGRHASKISGSLKKRKSGGRLKKAGVVPVHTGIPPKVEGQLRCFLKLCVTHVSWFIQNPPDVTHVSVKWWGEDGDGAVFRPRNTSKTKEKQIGLRTRARYAVKSGPKQLSAYLADTGSLVFEVQGRKNDVVGRAQVDDISKLSPTNQIKGVYPVLSSTSSRIAELEICLSLEPLMDSYDSSNSNPTTDVSYESGRRSASTSSSGPIRMSSSSPPAVPLKTYRVHDSDASTPRGVDDLIFGTQSRQNENLKDAETALRSDGQEPDYANRNVSQNNNNNPITSRYEIGREQVYNKENRSQNNSNPSDPQIGLGQHLKHVTDILSRPDAKKQSSISSLPQVNSSDRLSFLNDGQKKPVSNLLSALLDRGTKLKEAMIVSTLDSELNRGDIGEPVELEQDGLGLGESDTGDILREIQPDQVPPKPKKPMYVPLDNNEDAEVCDIESRAVDLVFGTNVPSSDLKMYHDNIGDMSPLDSLSSDEDFSDLGDPLHDSHILHELFYKNPLTSDDSGTDISSDDVSEHSAASSIKQPGNKRPSSGKLSRTRTPKRKSQTASSGDVSVSSRKVLSKKQRRHEHSGSDCSDNENNSSRFSESSRVSFDLNPSDCEDRSPSSKDQNFTADGLSVERLTLLGRVHVARVSIETLHLDIGSLIPVPVERRESTKGRPPIPSANRVRPNTYFVEYQFPVVAVSRDRYLPNTMATEVMRVASKNVRDNVVNFSHRSVFPVRFDGNSIEKWWSSSLVLKVYTRAPEHNKPTFIGSCAIPLKSILKSDVLCVFRQLDVLDRSTKLSRSGSAPPKAASSQASSVKRRASEMPKRRRIGVIKAAVELASDSKDFAKSLAKVRIAELMNEHRVAVAAKNSSKIQSKSLTISAAPIVQRSQALSEPASALHAPPVVVTQPSEATLQPGASDSWMQSGEVLTLHTLVSIPEGQNITLQGTSTVDTRSNINPAQVPTPTMPSGGRGWSSRDMATRNPYLVCRMFWCEDVVTSNVCWGSFEPQFNFVQTSPVLLTKALLERMNNNVMVIEVWDKKTTAQNDQLIGIVKISLHQFYMSFRDRRITQALLKSQYPVVAMDNYVPIINPYSGNKFGQLKVLVAMGSVDQVSALQRVQLDPTSASVAPQRPDNFLERSPIWPQEDTFIESVDMIPIRSDYSDRDTLQSERDESEGRWEDPEVSVTGVEHGHEILETEEQSQRQLYQSRTYSIVRREDESYFFTDDEIYYSDEIRVETDDEDYYLKSMDDISEDEMSQRRDLREREGSRTTTEDRVDHCFDIVVEGIRGLQLFEDMIWGEADCFVQYYFPTQQIEKKEGGPIKFAMINLQPQRSSTTLCIPDPTLHDVKKHKITLPVGTPVQKEILKACAGAGGGGGGIPFEVWARFYHPNVRDQVIAKAVLPLAKLCAMVTMQTRGETSVQSFPLMLSRVPKGQPSTEEYAKQLDAGQLDVTINYKSVQVKGRPAYQEQYAMSQDITRSQVCLSVNLVRGSGLKTAAEALARYDSGMQYPSEVGLNVYIRVKVSFLKKEDERITRTIARTFAPEFGHHMDFPCPLLWTESDKDALSLAEMLENAEATFELWHQVPGISPDLQGPMPVNTGSSQVQGRQVVTKTGDVLIGTTVVPLAGLLSHRTGVNGWYAVNIQSLGWDTPVSASEDGYCSRGLERVGGGLEIKISFPHHSDRERVLDAARGVGWCPEDYLPIDDDMETADESSERHSEITVTVDIACFPMVNALIAGQSKLDTAAHCYVRYKIYDKRAICSKLCGVELNENDYIVSKLRSRKTFFIQNTPPFYWYMREECMEIQLWVSYGNTCERERPKQRDKLIGSAYVDMSPLSDRRRKQHRVSGMYPLFKPGSASLGGAYLRAHVSRSPCKIEIMQSDSDEDDVGVAGSDSEEDVVTRRSTASRDKSSSQRPSRVPVKEEEPFMPIEKTFKALVSVERALHLPIMTDRDGQTVAPNCYVSYQNAEKAGPTFTELHPNSCDPVWNYEVATRLDNEHLSNDNKNLVFKVWHRPTAEVESPDKSLGRVIGFVSVDLVPLSSGLNEICGWYNIMDFSGSCHGQVKLSVKPCEAIGKMQKRCDLTPSKKSSIYTTYATASQYSAFPSHLAWYPEQQIQLRSSSYTMFPLEPPTPDDSPSQESIEETPSWTMPFVPMPDLSSKSRSSLFKALQNNMDDLDKFNNKFMAKLGMGPKESLHKDSLSTTETITIKYTPASKNSIPRRSLNSPPKESDAEKMYYLAVPKRRSKSRKKKKKKKRLSSRSSSRSSSSSGRHQLSESESDQGSDLESVSNLPSHIDKSDVDVLQPDTQIKNVSQSARGSPTYTRLDNPNTQADLQSDENLPIDLVSRDSVQAQALVEQAGARQDDSMAEDDSATELPLKESDSKDYNDIIRRQAEVEVDEVISGAVRTYSQEILNLSESNNNSTHFGQKLSSQVDALYYTMPSDIDADDESDDLQRGRMLLRSESESSDEGEVSVVVPRALNEILPNEQQTEGRELMEDRNSKTVNAGIPDRDSWFSEHLADDPTDRGRQIIGAEGDKNVDDYQFEKRSENQPRLHVVKNSDVDKWVSSTVGVPRPLDTDSRFPADSWMSDVTPLEHLSDDSVSIEDVGSDTNAEKHVSRQLFSQSNRAFSTPVTHQLQQDIDCGVKQPVRIQDLSKKQTVHDTDMDKHSRRDSQPDTRTTSSISVIPKICDEGKEQMSVLQQREVDTERGYGARTKPPSSPRMSKENEPPVAKPNRYLESTTVPKFFLPAEDLEQSMRALRMSSALHPRAEPRTDSQATSKTSTVRGRSESAGEVSTEPTRRSDSINRPLAKPKRILPTAEEAKRIAKIFSARFT